MDIFGFFLRASFFYGTRSGNQGGRVFAFGRSSFSSRFSLFLVGFFFFGGFYLLFIEFSYLCRLKLSSVFTRALAVNVVSGLAVGRGLEGVEGSHGLARRRVTKVLSVSLATCESLRGNDAGVIGSGVVEVTRLLRASARRVILKCHPIRTNKERLRSIHTRCKRHIRILREEVTSLRRLIHSLGSDIRAGGSVVSVLEGSIRSGS